MKRISILFLAVLSLTYSCKDSDLQDDVNELKEKVANIEKTKTVISVEFEGTNMIVTYNTGEKTTLPMPAGLNGKDGTNGTNGIDGTNGTNGTDGINGTNGTNGQDGNGIKTIDYSEVTGILKITLTNDNVSEFKVVVGSNGIDAVLISDINGKMLVKSVHIGAVPIAEFTYDANYNTIGFVNNHLDDGKVYKVGEINKVYSNNVLSALTYKTFYYDQGPKINSEYLEDNKNDTIATVNVEYFTKSNGDGTFRFYEWIGTISSTQWKYRIYPIAVKQTYTNSDFPYSYTFKVNSTLAYRCDRTYVKNITGTNYEVWFYAVYKYTKSGSHNIGDVRKSKNYNIECNAAGQIEKIYENGTTPDRYLYLTYNSLGAVTKSQEYINNGTDWVKSGNELVYVYNSKNLLDSVKRIYPDKSFSVRTRLVYDQNGNPIEIYAYMDRVISKMDYYDPIDYPEDPWRENRVVTQQEGLRLIAKIEYDYAYKNFLGNSISAILPAMENYKFYNAIKRVSGTETQANASVEYKDFNDKGYPETIIVDTYDEELYNIRIENAIEYITKE